MNTVRIHENSEEEPIILLLLIYNHYIKCFFFIQNVANIKY
jgi:hypothetical protein